MVANAEHFLGHHGLGVDAVDNTVAVWPVLSHRYPDVRTVVVDAPGVIDDVFGELDLI